MESESFETSSSYSFLSSKDLPKGLSFHVNLHISLYTFLTFVVSTHAKFVAIRLLSHQAWRITICY